ncbi:MAG: hypothetical protein JWN01_514 [Patescibacteria group bacterium]|nr:hypothetical protein [Patescibacteria group bacterium]
MNAEPATEVTKTTLENSVNWFLADKLQNASTPIATKKYLTNQNVLVYLTSCNVAELSIPRVKVQVLSRVPGGVHEVGYQLFGDHRLEKYNNDMIFGTKPGSAAGDQSVPVYEPEAQELLALVNGLGQAQQTL